MVLTHIGNRMTVIFVSNYFNHHQKPFCDWMYELLGPGNFWFVANEKVSEWRKSLGYKEITADYVVNYSESFNTQIMSADVVIFGHVSPFFDSMIKKRIQQKKIIIKSSERIYKVKPSFIKLLYHWQKYIRLFGNTPYSYLLAASAYCPYDYSRLHVFKRNMLKWGYFPETKHYDDIDNLISHKKPNSLLWVSRFIDWKHPELPIRVAERLKMEVYQFHMNMIGTGELIDEYKQLILAKNLNDCITILGSMSPEEVRSHMEQSQILLFTSDRKEGWGAVLNEAMNSACAVVACREIGSVPYLLNNDNGITFTNEDDLYEGVKSLLDNPLYREQISYNAYRTITEEWSAKNAAERFVSFFKARLKGDTVSFASGPCSKAPIIKG